MTEPKSDGLGNAIDPTGDYYVLDSRTCVGNCGLWWRANGSGYACDLDDVGVYKGADVLGMRDTDVPWPTVYVLARTVRHVRTDVQAFSLHNYRPGPRT